MRVPVKELSNDDLRIEKVFFSGIITSHEAVIQGVSVGLADARKRLEDVKAELSLREEKEA